MGKEKKRGRRDWGVVDAAVKDPRDMKSLKGTWVVDVGKFEKKGDERKGPDGGGGIFRQKMVRANRCKTEGEKNQAPSFSMRR